MRKRCLPRRIWPSPRTCVGHRRITPAVDRTALRTKWDAERSPARALNPAAGVALLPSRYCRFSRLERVAKGTEKDDGQLDTRDGRLGSVRCVESRSRDPA